MGLTVHFEVLNQLGTPMMYSSSLATRPAAGIQGRIFFNTASPYGIYRDNGTTWDQIAGSGSGSITGSGTVGTLALFTPTGSSIGNSKITQSGSDINIDANINVTNGNINLPANNTVGGTNYKIQQVMATNDGWSIYGNAVATDRGEVVFEVSDNGAVFNPAGQRYRFHYEATSSGSNKDVLIIDYNLSSFTTAIDVNHIHTALGGATNPYGQQIAVTNTFNAGITWTALLACFNTSSLMNNEWNGSATFGNGSYTANNVNVLYNTFNNAASTITSTQAAGIRTWANQILQLRIDGTNNGTYTHFANSAIYGDFASSTALLTITNRYGYLVNDLDEYSAGHTYTNRWAFYNAGVNDNNYFAGKTILTVKFNRQTASYTLVSSDRSKLVEMNVATANNLTVPLNSSVPFDIGTQIEVSQYGAGQTTIVPTSGVTVRSASGNLKIASQYVGVSLIKVATDEWYLFGNLSA
jgi:hypothetical protein